MKIVSDFFTLSIKARLHYRLISVNNGEKYIQKSIFESVKMIVSLIEILRDEPVRVKMILYSLFFFSLSIRFPTL